MADVGIGDLFEDGFGFGTKTVRTVIDAIRSPRKYFLAAQTKDWSGYSPSIRVYVVLLAISSYFRYLYLGEGQVMTEMYVGQFEQVLTQLSETDKRWLQVSARDLANGVLERLFFWAPFVSFAAYTIFGVCWGAYAEKLPVAVRVRYIYALMIPATMFMLVATLIMVSLPDAYASTMSFISLIGSMIVVGITAYFGAFPETESKGGRFGRAFVLGVILIVVMFISTSIALIIGVFETMLDAYAATTPIDAQLTE